MKTSIEPVTECAESLAKRFAELTATWKEETRHSSKMKTRMEHPAFREIVALGKKAVPLILDNLEDKVRPASERTDLIPVYSFNDDDLLLAGQIVTSARPGSSLQIRLWRLLLAKLEQELLY